MNNFSRGQTFFEFDQTLLENDALLWVDIQFEPLLNGIVI